MGSGQSSPEKQRLTAQCHLLVVRDPTAWQRLSNQGIAPVYLSPSFAPALVPSFLAILEPFYTGEYRRALERCGEFTAQLSAMQIGHMYDPTVRYYCILRLMIQLHMGYYCYPTDLPVPNPPHLEPVPGDKAIVSDVYIVHRLLSAMFDTLERSAAQLREHGWDTEQTNPIVKDNIAFFKKDMQRFAVHASAPHPLPELHVWFWTYLFQFIVERQHYLGVFASLKDPKAVFIKKHGTAMVARLAAERRPEAFLLVVSRWATQSMGFPETFIPTAQGLLDCATTKNQQLLLRLAALVNAMPLLQKGKLDPGLFIAEGRACLALAEQAQLNAAAACITLALPGQILPVLTSNAQRLVSIGRYIEASQEDKRRVDTLLALDNEAIQAHGGMAAMRIMRETFDRETHLWGGMAPRNGHRSAFISHLHNWCDDILSQDSPSLGLMTVVACSAVAAHRLAVGAGRAPEWELGQKMLWSAFRLLQWYYDNIYHDATPSQQIVQLLHEVIVAGIQDQHRIPAWKNGTGNDEFYNRYSSWVSRL